MRYRSPKACFSTTASAPRVVGLCLSLWCLGLWCLGLWCLGLCLSLVATSASAQDLIFANGFESGDLRAWSPDQDGPKILGPSPSDGTWLTDDQTVVSARIVDVGVVASGLDPSTWILELDGVDHSAEAVLDQDFLSWTASDLAEGSHVARITARDLLGNTNSVTWTFSVDTLPPTVQIVGPTSLTLRSGEAPTFDVRVTDGGSGLSIVPLRAEWNGVPLPCGLSSGSDLFPCRGPVQTSDATLSVVLFAEDTAGNGMQIDPVIFDLQVDETAPMITIADPGQGAWVRSPFTITGSVTDDTGVVSVEIGDSTAKLDGSRGSAEWSAELELEDGEHSLLATGIDLHGRRASVRLDVQVDTVPPELEIQSPKPASIVNGDSVFVVGFAEDLDSQVSVEIEGSPVAVVADEFRAQVPIAEGLSTLTVVVTDEAGNQTTQDLEVTRWPLPEVAITSPMDLSTLAATTIDVEGTISAGATVQVNGIIAAIDGTTFQATDVPLVEGGTLITAVATDENDRQSTDTILVVRDLTPPRITVYRPIDGATTHSSSIVVAGLINDLVPGTVNADEVSVTVDGVPATVVNRSFALPVTLSPGVQVLLVEAVDAGGNVAQETVEVHFEPATTAHLQIVAGDGQSGAINSTLPQPLVVRALDGSGDPVAGVTIIFSVEQGNGLLDADRRRTAWVTDAAGEASVMFQLGDRAGVSNQVVSAQAAGYGLPIYLAADAVAGPPSTVIADSGVEQTGIAGFPVPRPLVAVVTDAGFNRLPGVLVIFRVEQGDGSFPANDLQEIVVPTDSDGRAIVELRLDPSPGVANTVVTAEVDGAQVDGAQVDGAQVDGAQVDGVVSQATFVGSGVTAGDPAQTAITGVVLDNSGQAIEGVTVQIKETALSTTTDAAGFFRIEPAPVGTVYLLVDGSTATRPGVWPHLEYVVTTVPGNTVDVGMPIHLLPLDLASGVDVDENTGGSLQLPDIPGFRLDIEPGAVTFPGGGRSGTVSVTAVHFDRVPMTPGFGQQPRLIVTVQPAGARFDPPARLTLPNVENLTPGSVTEMYSFDHDLGQFVSIGPASVSANGAEIIADPGVGIVKAGWHCGGDPAPAGTPHRCPSCKICNGSTCVPGCPVSLEAFGCSSGTCSDTRCEKRSCQGGRCKRTKRKVRSIEIQIDGSPASEGVVVPTGKSVSFSAQIEHDCEELAVRWFFQPTIPGADLSSQSFSATLETPGPYRGKLLAQCKMCSGSSKTERFELTAFEIKRIESDDQELMEVPKGSAGDDVFPFAAVRQEDGEATLRAIVEPDLPPSKLEGKITWSGDGSAVPGDPTRFRVSLGEPAKLTPTVDAPGSDGRHEKSAWAYVVGAEPNDFSPQNGRLGSSFREYECGFWNTEGCGVEHDVAWDALVFNGGYLETGVVPPFVAATDEIALGTRAEYQFAVQPEVMALEVESGLIGTPPVKFHVYQYEQSCIFNRIGPGEWQLDVGQSSFVWTFDDCCSARDDSDPWDGEGLLHGNDSPSVDFLTPTTTGHVFKLNLRAHIQCFLEGTSSSDSTRCGDYLRWRSELWVERDLETGMITSPAGSNIVTEDNLFWGDVPIANGCVAP